MFLRLNVVGMLKKVTEREKGRDKAREEDAVSM